MEEFSAHEFADDARAAARSAGSEMNAPRPGKSIVTMRRRHARRRQMTPCVALAEAKVSGHIGGTTPSFSTTTRCAT
ncbi:hypothetical protein QFZ97_004760 [Paraburkholderia youngii]